MIEIAETPTLPPRATAAHKGTYGTVLIVAGSADMMGAAILAARGALRGGAGLVRCCVPPQHQGMFTAAVPCATTLPRDDDVTAWFAGATAAVAGPGLSDGPATAELVAELCRVATVPLVLDADALNVIAPLEQPLAVAAAVVTPHPGEAARLLSQTTVQVQSDRRAAAAELARRSGQVAVLKGHGTLVCDGERMYQCRTGNPGMATGGAGDVLAGLIGALLAQGLPVFEAACLGVHVHGAAGDLVAARLSQPGLLAEDLPLAIAEVLGR